MKALRMRAPGGPDVLEIVDAPAPRPREDELLVRVRAAGLNGADLVQRRGNYPPPPGVAADLLGLEFAGDVIETGERVRRFKVGDRVMGLVGGAGQAEFVAVPEAHAMPVPVRLTDIEAGGCPEAFVTAHDALFAQANVSGGERVLVHAVGSGVGSAALQLAKARGCSVIGTARQPTKIERAMELGLDEGIDAAGGSFADAVLEATKGAGVDVVIDFVGAPYLLENLAVLARRGRLVFVSTLGGQDASLPIGTVMRKRLTLVGTVLRSRNRDEKAAAIEAFASFALPLFETGALTVPVDTVFSLAEALAAHRYVEENRNFGKVVFEIGG